MKEFNIDLVIDKTFNVFAETVEEAKELAIQKACLLLDSYNSLCIDQVEEVGKVDFSDDAEFSNVYTVLCFDKDGMLIDEYEIEADNTLGAATATEGFFYEDHPDDKLYSVRVIPVDTIQYDEYYFNAEEE